MMEQINRDSEDCTDDETMVKEKERKTDGTRKRGQYKDDTLLIRQLLKVRRQ